MPDTVLADKTSAITEPQVDIADIGGDEVVDFPSEEFPGPGDAPDVEDDESGLFNPPAKDVPLAGQEKPQKREYACISV